jgi:ferredoxin
VAQAAETLRCNVCEVTVEAKEAKEHSASKEHTLRKQKLEGDWKETASRMYNHDNSVVVQWAASIHEH